MTPEHEDEARAQDLSAAELDDQEDREELRQRYYGLLQELRVLLPGVQVLVAFLLTAPFAQRFADLDATGRKLYALSLASGLVSIVAFIAPTAFHRFGKRRTRSRRLVWAIRMLRIGLVAMAVALDAALLVVMRMVFDDTAALVAGTAFAIVAVVCWIVLPATLAGADDEH